MNDARRFSDRFLPLLRIGLLRPDMKHHAQRIEAQVAALEQQLTGHLDVAPELARQRPVGVLTAGEQSTHHAGARCVQGELLELGLTVERETAHAVLCRRTRCRLPS